MQRTTHQHRNAVLLMLACTLMWSLGGVLSRSIHDAGGFEKILWRSVFAALTVAIMLAFTQGKAAFARMQHAGVALWLSGLCWAIMFSCFMMALSLTTVANVLVTQSLAPVFTALLAWLILRRAIAPRVWLTILAAACGIALMYVFDVAGLGGKHTVGVLIALGIPVAAAVNFVILQRGGQSVDFSAAVLIGGVISALIMLPLAMPLRATPHDIGVLVILGVVQLGIPCVLMVWAARFLAAPEVALLALLEVIFGMLWAWLFAGERPGTTTLIGGAMVLCALAANEIAGMRSQRDAGAARAVT
jgi:drug/metabolite transporter (DMT)-like permease